MSQRFKPVNILNRHQDAVINQFLGDRSERDPPVPIPNTEVKPLSPDCTARASVWETRKLPGVKRKAREKSRAFFVDRVNTSMAGRSSDAQNFPWKMTSRLQAGKRSEAAKSGHRGGAAFALQFVLGYFTIHGDP